jgi:hypothetical protein
MPSMNLGTHVLKQFIDVPSDRRLPYNDPYEALTKLLDNEI